ncbi:MAG: hypothetical protein WC732_06260 [Candidatus Omnitrophota bacterium]
MKLLKMFFTVCILNLCLYGCASTQEGLERDTERAGDEIEDTVEDIAD